MTVFLLIVRIIYIYCYLRLFYNALEIFSLTRNWSVFIPPLLIVIVIEYLFKILKKVTK